MKRRALGGRKHSVELYRSHPESQASYDRRTTAERQIQSEAVSEISRFFGIVIAMYHREHEPAHFHARYGGKKVTVRIADAYIHGTLPPRVEALVVKWWNLHREELAENWQLAKELKELKPIQPLE